MLMFFVSLQLLFYVRACLYRPARALFFISIPSDVLPFVEHVVHRLVYFRSDFVFDLDLFCLRFRLLLLLQRREKRLEILLLHLRVCRRFRVTILAVFVGVLLLLRGVLFSKGVSRHPSGLNLDGVQLGLFLLFLRRRSELDDELRLFQVYVQRRATASASTASAPATLVLRVLLSRPRPTPSTFPPTAPAFASPWLTAPPKA